MNRTKIALGCLAALATALAVPGCKPEIRAQRWGGCTTMGADHCGVVLTRGSDRLDLTCDTGPKPPVTPKAPLPLPLRCRCVENGVEKRTASLAEPVADDFNSERAIKTAQTACGW